MEKITDSDQKLDMKVSTSIDKFKIDEIDEVLLHQVLPNIEPTWITIFPELNVYRFLSVDEYDTGKGKTRDGEWYKPIIMINGYQSSRHTWDFFAQRLWNTGFRNIFALELQDFSKPIESFYLLLDNTITSILSFLHIFESVTLIGHSLGGIYARYYVKHNENRNKNNVSLLITMGAPHYGMFKSLHYFESFFKHIFPPETVELFSVENGVHKDVNNIYHEEEFDQITMINVQGALKRLAGGDGTFKPGPVGEMINLVEHRNHFKLNKSHRVFNHLKPFLCNNVSIFKIQVEQIDFPFIQILNSFYIHFTIKVQDQKEQRYPFLNELEIASNVSNLSRPLIIFAGPSDLKDQIKRITLSISRKKRLTSEKLIEQSFSIQLANDEPIVDEKIIENQIVSCKVKVISYQLGKEL